MDKRLLLHLIVIFVLSAAGGIMAQDQAWPSADKMGTTVQSLDVENGLPQGYVNGIVQDSTGFIWLGTRDGLARYDGYQVKTFHYDPRDSATIASDVIQTIYLDRKDHIWVLYENAAVDIFDPVTERVRHIRPDGPLGWLLSERELRPFVLQEDSRGRYWVVSSDLKQLRYFTMRHPWPVNIPLEGQRIIALREGRDGQMYVCTDRSFYRVSDDRLHKISDLPHRRATRNDRIGQMAQDKAGSWVIANNGYLEILEPGGDWESVSLPDPGAYSPFYFVDNSPSGDLYIASSNRVFLLNSNHSLSLIWTNPDKPGDIPAMMIDRSNVLWLGTNTFGARMIHLSSGGFHSYTYHRGFVLDVLRQYFHFSPAENYTRAMDPYLLRYASDRNGGLWLLGTPFIPGGLPTAKAPRRLLRLAGGDPSSARLQADSLYWLQFAFDHRNDCWGIVLDREQDTLLVKTGLTAGTAVPEPSWRPASTEIGYLAAFQDKLCIVYKKGIELYDPANGRSVYYKSEDVFGNVQLLMAAADPKDPAILWITSLGYGLIRFDTRNGRVRAFTTRDAVPSNSVYAAVPDEKGRLWCSSNKGIFRFDPLNHQVLSFVAKDGLQGNEFNRYHFFRSPGGHIFFGGTRGWTAFHPDSIYVDPYQPETVITDILVNNTPVSEISEWKNQPVTALRELSLAHDQNFITLTFAGLQFSNGNKLQYRYQLEGFDEHWIEVGNQHIAGYTNLPPGKYIFRVNSSNEAGAWSNHVKTLPLVVRPPWWKTWWSYVLYAFILTGCAYVYYRYRAGRLLIRQQMIRQQEEAKQLKVMDEMKTRFFSNITHEFRTPLSLIIAPLEQIGGEAETPPSIRKRINSIQSNAHQLLRLINQLLDMSKMEAGNMKVSLSRGNLGRFIADHVKGFETQARLKNIRLDMNNSLAGEYDFDADKWQKILFNLLSNAIKFTPGGGAVNVSLNVRYDDGTSHAVALEVKDAGIGIPEDQLPFIFNRFYQVDDSGTRTHRGTGIGLALVKELAELMDGIVEVESTPGNGALFRVTIPVAKASGRNRALPLEPLPAESLPAEPDNVHRYNQATGDQAKTGDEAANKAVGDHEEEPGDRNAALILLAEDNEELNSFVAGTLAKDYQVIRAFNGREALLMAKEQLPHLVISDVMMPEMDGYALCEELKGSVVTDHIAFILLSAKASHESVVKGLRHQADDYITKPFHIDELQLRVHNLLERQRTLREYCHRQLTAPTEQLSTETVANMFLKQLYAIVEEHLDNPRFDVGTLAGKMAVSRRTLNRKLSILVNLSASEVVKQYRLKRAGQLLESGLNVSETAYRVGFTSVSYFSNSFKEFHDVVPSEYASRRHKQEEQQQQQTQPGTGR